MEIVYQKQFNNLKVQFESLNGLIEHNSKYAHASPTLRERIKKYQQLKHYKFVDARSTLSEAFHRYTVGGKYKISECNLPETVEEFEAMIKEQEEAQLALPAGQPAPNSMG